MSILNRLQLFGRHRDAADAADIETVADNIADVNNVAANMTAVTNVDGALPTLTANEGNINAVADNIADVNAVAVIATEIETVSDNMADVNAVVANQANVNTVAGDIANVNTVATNQADVGAVATNMADVNAVAANQADIDTVAANMADVNAVAGANADIDIVVANISDIQAAALLAEYNDNELDFPSRDFRLDTTESLRAVQSLVNGQVVSAMQVNDILHFGDGLMPVPANLTGQITLTVQMSSAETGKDIYLKSKFYDGLNVNKRGADYDQISVPNDTSEFTISLNVSLLNTDVTVATVGRVEIQRLATTGSEHGGELQVKRAVVTYV